MDLDILKRAEDKGAGLFSWPFESLLIGPVYMENDSHKSTRIISFSGCFKIS